MSNLDKNLDEMKHTMPAPAEGMSRVSVGAHATDEDGQTMDIIVHVDFPEHHVVQAFQVAHQLFCEEGDQVFFMQAQLGDKSAQEYVKNTYNENTESNLQTFEEVMDAVRKHGEEMEANGEDAGGEN